MSDNDAASEISSLRDELSDTGVIELQLATDSEWRLEMTTGEHGQTVKDLLRETGCDEKLENMKYEQERKGKTIEGVKLHIKHSNGTVEGYDSLSAAYDVHLADGDRLKITYKIGNA